MLIFFLHRHQMQLKQTNQPTPNSNNNKPQNQKSRTKQERIIKDFFFFLHYLSFSTVVIFKLMKTITKSWEFYRFSIGNNGFICCLQPFSLETALSPIFPVSATRSSLDFFCSPSSLLMSDTLRDLQPSAFLTVE